MKLIPVFFPVFLTLCIKAQNETVVAENTFKVSGLSEKVFYYGFAEGDQVLFDFETLNNKELKKLEIIEYPSNPKFMGYEARKIEKKTFNVPKTGIYKFRFANKALLGRICKFKIRRIPANEQYRNFSTGVYWRKVYDTTYTTKSEKHLRSDTTVSNVTEEVAKVHSVGNLNGNQTILNFTLPKNTTSWSYYIGVNQAGQQIYDRASRELTKNMTRLVLKIPGYGPLAALAMGGLSYLSTLQSGEDIDFCISETNTTTGQSTILKRGKIINDFSKMKTDPRDMYYINLSNDNAITGVTVFVKITAIVVNNEWETRPVRHIHLRSREEAYLKN